MENQTILNKLNDKISQIVEKYDVLKTENNIFRTQVVTLQAEKEVQEQIIVTLREENLMKDLEIEEIVTKIEAMLK